jgi:type IV pilus assembly protein PilE
MNQQSRQRGMTLIELVVVMIIIGVLAAVAIPSYRSYVLRSQRSDAKDGLLALATQQEKFYLQCNRYADDIAGAPNCAAFDLQGADVSENGWYALTIIEGDLDSYIVEAEAIDGENQFQDTACRFFRVDQAGVRSARDAGGADNTAECWR